MHPSSNTESKTESKTEPRIITATYRIVTPMFISGANKNDAELRIPSIKGALRFWWRALNWQCTCPNSETNTSQAKGKACQCTQALYKREAAIFGGAIKSEQEKKITTNQSLALFKLLVRPSKGKININDNSLKYMSFGIESNQGFDDTSFTIQAIIKPQTCNKVIEEIKDTMSIFGLLGGLGKLARKGFGSVAIQTIKDNQDKKNNPNFANFNQNEYTKKIIDILSSPNYPAATQTAIPPYSAFSSKACFSISKQTKRNANDTHASVSESYKKIRANKTNDDEQRKAFGTSNPKRASPIFIHIHPIQADNQTKYISTHLYLPDTDTKNDELIKQFINDNADIVDLNKGNKHG